MAKRVEFERLRTMEDVHRERLRVRKDIQHYEHLLEKDAKNVGELLSPDYWLSILSAKIAGIIEEKTSRIASRLRGFASGMGIVDKILGGFGKRFFGAGSSRRRPVYVEEDIYYDPEMDELDIFIDENRSC